jgi:DNA-binding transcriptional regulator YiaG
MPKEISWGARVRQLRYRMQLTQKQFGAIIGCPESTIQEWEQHRRVPVKWVRGLALDKWKQKTTLPS